MYAARIYISILLIVSTYFSILPTLNQQDTSIAYSTNSVSLDTIDIVLPDDLKSALIIKLQQRPVGLIEGTKFAVASTREVNNWMIISLSSLDSPLITDNFSPHEASLLVIAFHDVSRWEVALESTYEFNMAVRSAPTQLLSPEAKHLLNTDVTIKVAPMSTMTYKFPWAAGQSWTLSQSWHGTDATRSALDFGTFSSNKRVLVAARGVVTRICVGNISVDVSIRDANGFTLGYIHLEKKDFDQKILGKELPQGYFLGVAKPGTWNDSMPTCGYNPFTQGQQPTYAHIHWILPTTSITVDGCIMSYPTNYFNCSGNVKTTGSTFLSSNDEVTTYQGQYVAQNYQSVMLAGSTQIVQIQIRNTGTATWDSNTKVAPIPRDQPSPFYDPATWQSDGRIMSIGTVAPGEIKTLEFGLRAPTNPGQYKIEFGFLQEGVTWFTEPSDGFIHFPIDVRFAVGAGSSRQQFFIDAYNRNGGSAHLGYPIAAAAWSGLDSDAQRAVIQGFDSGAVILHNEQDDTPPNTVPAYVLSGQLLQHFQSLDGSRSWLGAGPTSDQFTNSAGQLQSNFPNGYIVTDGSSTQAVDWPKPVEGQWRAEYHNGKNLSSGATWVQNEPNIDHNWGEAAPGQGRWGVWADDFSVRWTGRFSFTQGKHTFTAAADDRIRIWIDGNLMLDAWEQVPPYHQHTFSMDLTSGAHTIRVEYGENLGSGAARFTWEQNTNKLFIPIALQ